MKEHEAQSEGSRKLVLYVERDDATYGPVQTSSYLVENYLDDLLEKQGKLGKASLDKLLAGEISPVGYYLALLGMTEADLACRARVSRWKLRRHLRPRGFATMDLSTLARYAEVFGVPPAALLEVLVTEGAKVRVRREATANPLVVVTRVSPEEP